ncbi:hypothetical protein LXL04_028225 [Taraxacum kok-saghyz]
MINKNNYVQAIFEIGDEIDVTDRPDDYSLCFYPGDNVDIWMRDRWHKHRYVRDVGKKIAACILYTTNEEETSYFGKEDVRAIVNWKLVKGESTWTFTKPKKFSFNYCCYPIILTEYAYEDNVCIKFYQTQFVLKYYLVYQLYIVNRNPSTKRTFFYVVDCP